ncbi:hypothetical protein ABPG77_009998 [Micractinium sp. CCAP 211/92]
MQQTAPAGGTAARGCYKCGQSGHWSRDCTVPQSQWLPRQPWQQGGPGGSAQPGAGAAPAAPSPVPGGLELDNLDAEGAGQAPAGQTAAALRKEKRKRPKLTLDMLKGPKGLPDVYMNFPDAFRRQFKGRGHEASDLRRLLEMYKRWQDRIFPHGEFDAFIGSLERISGTNVLKHHMREKRTDLLREVQDIADPPHVQLQEAEAQPPAGTAGGAAAAGQEEEEEMLMLVEEEEYNEEHPELDDELLELLEEEPQPEELQAPADAGAAGGAAVGPAAEEEEEQLLELVMEEDEEGQAALDAAGEEQLTLAQEAEGDGAQPPVAAATQLDEEEEERRLLAMAADDEGAEEMGPPSTINLPAGTSTAAASLPRHPAHGTMAEQAPDSEDQALLQMLDAQLLPSQPGGGSAAGAHAMDIAAQAEEAPHQLQATPLLGAGTEEQPSVWTVADGAEAEDVSVSAAREAAAAMEPSLVLGTGTEEQAMAFEPSPLLGECTEEQLPIDGQAHFVPETEQQPGTQEL